MVFSKHDCVHSFLFSASRPSLLLFTEPACFVCLQSMHSPAFPVVSNYVSFGTDCLGLRAKVAPETCTTPSVSPNEWFERTDDDDGTAKQVSSYKPLAESYREMFRR